MKCSAGRLHETAEAATALLAGPAYLCLSSSLPCALPEGSTLHWNLQKSSTLTHKHTIKAEAIGLQSAFDSAITKERAGQNTLRDLNTTTETHLEHTTPLPGAPLGKGCPRSNSRILERLLYSFHHFR